MKHKSWLVHWVFATLVVFIAGQVVAGDGHINNPVAEKSKCGHERVGKVQYVKNSADSNSYKVKIQTTEENTHLGCSMSESIPLSACRYTIVSEKVT